MFEQHFGRKPRGKVHVRIMQFPGGQQQYQFFEEPEPGPTENFYGNDHESISELADMTYKPLIEERDEPWVVLYYTPKSSKCQNIKELFSEWITA